MIINTSLKKKKNNRLIKKEPPKKPTEEDASNFNEWVNKKETNINSGIFQKFLKFQRPSDMFKLLYKTNNKEENKTVVDIIESGLGDLKNEIQNMGKEEKEIEKPSEIKDIVEEILKFNKQNQEGKGLKIPTADQMLNRLSLFLAQLKAG